MRRQSKLVMSIHGEDKGMMRKGNSILLSALVASIVTPMLLPARAVALDPDSSTRVDTVTIGDVYGKISTDNASTLLMGIDGCERAIEASADLTVTYGTTFDVSSDIMTAGIYYYQGAYYFETGRGTGSAPNCVASGCTSLGDSSVSRSSMQAVVNVPFKTLTGFTTAQECVASEIERDYFIRLQLYDGTNPDQADAKVTLDLIRPEPPMSFDAVVTQDGINLSWEPGASVDVTNYRIVYSTSEFTGDVFAENVEGARSVYLASTAANENSASIAELAAGSTVWVSVASVDAVGNESVLSAAKPFEVIETIGFWEYYKGNGGDEEGGYCQTSSSSKGARSPAELLLAGFALLGACLIGRRRRRHGAV